MKPIKSHTDQELVEALKSGDHQAFERLFIKYAQKLFNFSKSYLRSENDAEEIVQEVFLKIWNNRLSLKTDTSFQSYLFTIAFNAIKKSFNKKVKTENFKHEVLETIRNEEKPDDFEANYQYLLEKLNEVIENLPERRKEIFIKRKKEDKSIKQIAEELNISIKTVENQITAAIKQIKQELQNDFPDSLLFFSLFIERSLTCSSECGAF